MTAFDHPGPTARPRARQHYTGWWYKCPSCGYCQETEMELPDNVLHHSDPVSCEWCGQEYTVEYTQRDYG